MSRASELFDWLCSDQIEGEKISQTDDSEFESDLQLISSSVYSQLSSSAAIDDVGALLSRLEKLEEELDRQVDELNDVGASISQPPSTISERVSRASRKSKLVSDTINTIQTVVLSELERKLSTASLQVSRRRSESIAEQVPAVPTQADTPDSAPQGIADIPNSVTWNPIEIQKLKLEHPAQLIIDNLSELSAWMLHPTKLLGILKSISQMREILAHKTEDVVSSENWGNAFRQKFNSVGISDIPSRQQGLEDEIIVLVLEIGDLIRDLVKKARDFTKTQTQSSEIDLKESIKNLKTSCQILITKVFFMDNDNVEGDDSPINTSSSTTNNSTTSPSNISTTSSSTVTTTTTTNTTSTTTTTTTTTNSTTDNLVNKKRPNNLAEISSVNNIQLLKPLIQPLELQPPVTQLKLPRHYKESTDRRLGLTVEASALLFDSVYNFRDIGGWVVKLPDTTNATPTILRTNSPIAKTSPVLTPKQSTTSTITHPKIGLSSSGNSQQPERLQRVKLQKVYRSAMPITCSKNDVTYLIERLKIETLIDLRSHRELFAEENESVFKEMFPKKKIVAFDMTGMQYKTLSFFGALSKKSLRQSLHLPSSQPMVSSSNQPPQRSYGMSFSGAGSTAIVVPDETDNNSLLERYKNYLVHCQSQICQLLEKFTVVENYPILICCNTGKDRTGVIVALLLAILGVSNNSIVEDYHASQNRIDEIIAYHKQIKGSLDVIGEVNAPKEVMLGLLWFIEKKHGSVSSFLNSIGFSFAKQDLIRQCLLDFDS